MSQQSFEDPNGPYRSRVQARLMYLEERERTLMAAMAKLQAENMRLKGPPLWRRVYESGTFQRVMHLFFLLLCWFAGAVLIFACLATIGLFGRFLFWSTTMYSAEVVSASCGPVICRRTYIGMAAHDAGLIAGVPDLPTSN